MANKTSIYKPQLSKLEREIKLLRSFLIGIVGKDPEGNYRPEFVKKILKAAREKKEFVFRNKSSFLSRL
jgi:hypothetical protein